MRLHTFEIIVGLAGLGLLVIGFLAAGVAAVAWLAAASVIAGACWLGLVLARRRLSRSRNTA